MNLRDDLHRIADGAPVDPIAMAGVRAKARSIRRRRVGRAVGGAVVGVAAIAVGAVLVLPGGADHSSPGPATRTPSPTAPRHTPSDSASSISEAVIDVKLDNLPAERTTGASLTVPSWINGSLTDAHGDSIQVSSPVYDAVRDPASGDWFGMTFAQGQWTWTQWNVRGAVVSTTPSPGDRVAITPDGKTWAVMVENAGSPELRVYHSGAQAPQVTQLALPDGEPQNGAGVDAILPNGDIVFEGAPRDVRFGPPPGPFSQLSSFIISGIGAASDGSMMLMADGPDGHTCLAFESETGHRTGSECAGDNETYLPSGDGSLLMRAAFGAPNVPTSLSIAAAPGTPERKGPQLTEFKLRGGTVDLGNGAWVGNSFVLPVWSSGSWRLVWLSQDGYQVTRSLVTQGGSDASPYLLGAGPLNAQNP